MSETRKPIQRILRAAYDGRLFARVSQGGTFDVHEKAPYMADLSPEMAAWIRTPKLRPSSVRAAIRDGLIAQQGEIGEERWAAYGITPKGLARLASVPPTEEA